MFWNLLGKLVKYLTSNLINLLQVIFFWQKVEINMNISVPLSFQLAFFEDGEFHC